MKLVIQPVTIDEIFNSPIFPQLLDEYIEEGTRDPSLLGSLPNREAYLYLERNGMIAPLGVFFDGGLVGFCIVMFSGNLHASNRLVASTESLFVGSAWRAGGAGIKLLRAAEQLAIDRGSTGLYVTAPAGGRLEKVLPRIGFHEVSRVFHSNFRQENVRRDGI
jgi:GNAT superfamily N-acetyltransferase